MTKSQEARLNKMDFVWNLLEHNRRLLWDALNAFYAKHQHLSVKNYVFPSNYEDKNLRGYSLGERIYHIRDGSIKLTEPEKQRLTKMGFIWGKQG